MKKLSTLIIDNPLFAAQGIRIQEDVLDQPRKVTEYHYCRSNPKQRNQPEVYGLSKRAVEALGIDY